MIISFNRFIILFIFATSALSMNSMEPDPTYQDFIKQLHEVSEKDPAKVKEVNTLILDFANMQEPQATEAYNTICQYEGFQLFRDYVTTQYQKSIALPIDQSSFTKQLIIELGNMIRFQIQAIKKMALQPDLK